MSTIDQAQIRESTPIKDRRRQPVTIFGYTVPYGSAKLANSAFYNGRLSWPTLPSHSPSLRIGRGKEGRGGRADREGRGQEGKVKDEQGWHVLLSMHPMINAHAYSAWCCVIFFSLAFIVISLSLHCINCVYTRWEWTLLFFAH